MHRMLLDVSKSRACIGLLMDPSESHAGLWSVPGTAAQRSDVRIDEFHGLLLQIVWPVKDSLHTVRRFVM